MTSQQRHDFYGPIHKGLRLGSSRLLMALGQIETRDARAIAELIGQLRIHLQLAEEHLQHEDAEYNEPLRGRAPNLAAQLADDHHHHYVTFRELDGLIHALETADEASRAAVGRALYLRFSTYFGDDLAHMAREEQEALPAFHRHFSDQELMDMESRIIQSISPERLTQYYFIMLPGMNPAERATFLRYIRANAPPEAYSHILDDVARAALPPEQFRVLNEDLAYVA
ncbi:MAG: hypothetical protein EON95_17955 [Caulobacteraceae bacterium]|nr:MAG: hypothetical protein EON95_17955 [Caulobacteraceae bacterium]